MTDHDPNNLGDMAAAYAIGALDADEIKAFEALMAQSAEARRAVDEYREVGALLAHGAPPAQPSPDLRKRLMARVRAEKARSGANGKRTIATSQWLAWAAAAAGLIVGSVQTVRLLDLGDRLAGVESQAQTLARELQERQAMLDQILEPQTMLIVLTATDAQPPGMRIFWNRAANTVLINGLERILIQNILIDVLGQERAYIITAEAKGHLRQIIGPKTKELRRLCNLISG